MESSIKASDTTYGKFHISASESYLIPSLQRPLTWDKKEIEKFWDDVVENEQYYYIGNIVAIVSEGTTNRDQIIDGQQRLTTISLILIAIRDYISKNKARGFSEIEDIIDDLLIKYRREERQVRLSFFDDKSKRIYEALVYKEPLAGYDSNTQKKFIKNFIFIKEKLKDYSPKCKFNEIKDLLNKILNLQLIFTRCTNRSAAYSLFESINATGINLATTDLIKNSLFESLHSEKDKLLYVEKGWKKMFEIFNEDGSYLKTYIRHHWIGTVGYTSHSGLFDAFIKKFKDKELDYAKSLFSLSSVYIAMRDASIESLDKLPNRRFDLEEIKEVLTFLSFLGVDQIYSVLLFLYQNEPKTFKKDLIMLTAFQFIYKYIPGSPSIPEKKYFANFCEGRISKQDLFKGLYVLCEKQEEQFINKITEKVKFIEGKSGDIQFILEKYLYAKGGGGKFAKPTIEHIIPQDISDKIFKKFKCDKKEVFRKIHELGNLTILEQEENSNIKKFNQQFSKKKDLYKKHIFVENRNILEYGFSTDPELAITERGKDLAKDIYKIFLNLLKNGK